MHSVIQTAANDSGNARILQIEARFAKGFSGLQLIGNASDVCRDGKERARSALEAIDIDLPPQKLVVSLVPGDVKKDGSQFDLPLAVCLAVTIHGKPICIDPLKWMFAAELGLNGELRATRGSIPFVLTALERGLDGIVLARSAMQELRSLNQLQLPGFNRLKILGFDHLREVIAWLYDGVEPPDTVKHQSLDQDDSLLSLLDFDDMILSDELRDVAMTIAAGEHSLLMRGSPGTGKSMFAARVNSLLPKMDAERHLQALRLQSAITGEIAAGLARGQAPFRNPHHQSSAAAILGSSERPGEISLAHGGILFLDEFPEFRRDVLEGLREPLENGYITVSRAKLKVIWQAQVLLITACNNCPCGWFGSNRRKCRCGVPQLISYRQRISGPILDRIDVHINMPDKELNHENLFTSLSETSNGQTQMMRERVNSARQFAADRNSAFGIRRNCDIPARHLKDVAKIGEQDFSAAIRCLSAQDCTRRSIVRSFRVARTIADLDESDNVAQRHWEKAAAWTAQAAARNRGELIGGI